MNISQFRIILDFQYQGCVRSTVSGVFGNLKFNFRRLHKIEAKQRQQTGQRHENFNFDPSLLKGAMDKKADGVIWLPFLQFSTIFDETLSISFFF